MRVAVPVLSLLCLTACPPAGVRGTARTLPRGETRLYAYVAPITGNALDVQGGDILVQTTWIHAAYDVGLSHGLRENLEGALGLSSGGAPNYPALHGSLRLRLLAPDRWPLPVHVTLAPKATWRLAPVPDPEIPTFFGGSVGYAIRLPSHHLMIKPEVSLQLAWRAVYGAIYDVPFDVSFPGAYRLAIGVELSTLPSRQREHGTAGSESP